MMAVTQQETGQQSASAQHQGMVAGRLVMLQQQSTTKISSRQSHRQQLWQQQMPWT
jgi:hypothetical protein